MSTPVDVDWIYKVAEIVVLGGGVILAIARSGRLISRFENIAERQTAEISDLKMDVKELSKLVVETTKLTGHIALIEERQLLSGKRLDEMSARFNKYVDDQFDRNQDDRRHPA